MITTTLCLAAAAVGFRCGYFFGRHENRNAPTSPPPLQFRRRNPFVSEFQQQINDALDGYRSINYPDPSPDRRPTNPYSGEQITLTEGRTQRGNGNGGPTTPKPEITPRRRGSNPPPPGTKPQFPPVQIISPDGTTIGYRPIPSRPGANPPPREP
jgi:hypothetical protein